MSVVPFSTLDQHGTGEKARKLDFSPRRYVALGYIVIGLTFGVFGAWALTAPLASGIVASGSVSVESSRKTIQHLEGGIVAEIMAEEGDIVEAGEPILRLDATEAQGNYALLSTRLAMLRAQEARLIAESTDAATIDMPAELLSATSPDIQQAVQLQQALFKDRKATKDGQVAILQSRIDQLHEAINGLELQEGSIGQQLQSLTAEIDRLTRGHESGVVAENQIASMKRSRFELQGDLGGLTSEIAKLHQTISESELQIVQTHQEFVERAGGELRDLRSLLNETSERVKVARDVLDRTVVRAPVRGMIQNVRVHTIGGVIQPAEPFMDIIPLDDDLIVSAQIRPIDVDNVAVGQSAEVRFPAFSSKTTPVIFGTIAVLSQAAIEPTNSNQSPYYSARIQVDDADVPQNIREKLLPGMPVDVIISTGERTFVEYFVRPLTDMFYKGMREK